jgi:hypothetical protein
MKKLTNQSSNDGNVILFNLHTNARSINPISFPGLEAELPDRYSEMLFNSASTLPKYMRDVASNEFNLQLDEGAKAFVLNGDIDLIITAIEIGTRPKYHLLR